MSGLHHVGVRPRSLRYYTTERHSVMPARFRFTSESGHVRCTSSCPLRAKNRHLIYSMISSARPIKESGTDKPSALAALILIISSTVLTCWTGRSPGFSPLRMRPA